MRLSQCMIAGSLLALFSAARASAAPVIHVMPAPIDFGNTGIGMPVTLAVAVENTGDADLTVTQIDPLMGINPSSFTLSALPMLPTTLAAGASFTFAATFLPTTQGSFEASFDLRSNDPMTPNDIVPLLGAAMSPLRQIPELGETVDFGTVLVGTPSDPLKMSLTNIAAGPVAITSIVSSDPAAFRLDESATQSGLASGETATFSVTFVPPSPGEHTATVTVLIENDNAPAATIGVAGTGVFGGGCRCPAPQGCGCALGRRPEAGPPIFAFLVAAIALLLGLRRGRPRASSAS